MPLVPPRRPLTRPDRAFLAASAALLTGLTLWSVLGVRHGLVRALVAVSAVVCTCCSKVWAQRWKGRGRHRADGP